MMPIATIFALAMLQAAPPEILWVPINYLARAEALELQRAGIAWCEARRPTVSAVDECKAWQDRWLSRADVAFSALPGDAEDKRAKWKQCRAAVGVSDGNLEPLADCAEQLMLPVYEKAAAERKSREQQSSLQSQLSSREYCEGLLADIGGGAGSSAKLLEICVADERAARRRLRIKP